MTRKLLQWIGVLFVLGLVGAAVGGLLVLKDRIRLIVQLDQIAAGPDPVALVRDDVQGIQRELGELRTALGGNFERLGTALEERAEARHTTVQQLGVALVSVQQEQATTRAELGRLLVQLEQIDRRLVLLAEAPALAAAKAGPVDLVPEVAAAVVAPAAPGLQPAVEPIAPIVPTTAPAEPPVAAKKASFLSFSVPDARFQFTEPQDYVLAAELCRVGFDAKSTLHDFTGATAKVAGQFRADFDDPNGAFRGEVTCEAKTLVTGVTGRDTNMLEHLDAEHHPQIRFTIARFEPGAVDAEKMTAAGVIHGQLTIRGKSREVSMPVKVSVDASKRVAIEGQMPLKLSDYEIPVPSQLGGTITMQDEVNVWIALRARVMVGGRK